VDNSGDLEILVQSRHPIIAIETQEEERVQALVRDLAVRLDLPLFEWRSTRGLVRAGTSDPLYDTEKPLPALRSAAGLQTDAVYLFHDLQRYFEDPLVLRALRDIAQAFSRARRALILCAPEIPLPPDLRACTARVALDLPDAADLRRMAVRTLRELGAPRRIKMDLTMPDLERLIDSLRGLTLQEAQRLLLRAALDDLRLDRKDLQAILERKQELLARDGVLTLHPHESTLQQVGGLQNLKAWLKTRGAAFTPEAKTYGLEPPRGILLLGVQGCGKSLCAKAVAAEWGTALLQLDAGSLYDKFVGESEKNLRKALRAAEAMAPCVLWIDEIEKGFAARDSASDGGLSRRILGALLSWMQEHRPPVFLVATANEVRDLPPELLRKGRFDEIFFVDLPAGSARRSILAIHLARRKQDPARFDLARLAESCAGFSGAEIEAAVVSALYAAFAAKAQLADAHLLEALQAAVPLSRTCRESIESIRAWAVGRTVPAAAPDPPAAGRTARTAA
jgi:ATP-dependent 26S proteasome regulatory subunit